MDLRSLINKLDTLDQKQLLKESDEVFEALTGIQYSDVEALARQFPPPKDTERAAALAKMAKDNNLPGLFDPFTNKYVNANTGTFAKIGAYDAEVTVLKNKGLLPLGATTSNWGMGQDQATAQTGNLSAQEIIKKAYRADQIMDLALPKLANQLQLAPAVPVAKESLSFNIANSLMEEFGYGNTEVIVEAIDRAQHQELKKLVTDLKPYEGSNHQVAQVMVMFASYNRSRDQLIREILSLINRIKRRVAKKPKLITPAPKAAEAPAASQSGTPPAIQESIRIDLAEGAEDQWLYHSGSLAEGTLKFVNSRTNKVYARGTIVEDVDGTQYVLVEAPAIGANASNVPKPAPAAPAAGGNVPPQPTLNGKPSTGPKGQAWLEKYGKTHNPDGTPKTADTSTKKAEPERGTLQRVDDTIRAVANVWTGGWADNVEAKLNSWVNRTTYGDELKKSLARTDAASKSALIKFNAFGKEWAPSAYDAGTVIGGVSMLPSLGWKATAALVAADYGQEKLIRNPHNEKAIDGAEKGKSNNAGQGGKTDTGNTDTGIPPKGFPYDPKVEEIQKQLKELGYNLGTFGKNKDGVDGRLGQTTATALEKAKADGYTMGADGKLVKQAVAQEPAAPERGAYLPPGSTTDAAKEYSAADASRKALDANTPTDAEPVEDPKDIVGTIQLALGLSSTGNLGQADIAAFGEYVKKNGNDPYEALNKIISGAVAESAMSEAEKMSALKSRLTQLDEAGRAGIAMDFLTKLFSKGEKATAGAERATAGAERGAASSTDNVVTNKAKPDNPNIAGQNPYVQSRSGYGTGSQPTQFAKFENSAIGNLSKAIDDMVRGGKNPATDDIILAAEKGFAERFGFKAGQAFRGAINRGGKVLTFMKNRKWLLAFLLLAAAGFLWNALTPDDPNKVDPNKVDPNKVDPNKVDPSVPPKEEQGGMDADLQEDLDELRQRLQELVDGWPDDTETASTLAAAAEVGAKPANDKTASGQGGMNVAGSANSSKVLDVSRTRGAAGSSYDAMVAQDNARRQPK